MGHNYNSLQTDENVVEYYMVEKSRTHHGGFMRYYRFTPAQVNLVRATWLAAGLAVYGGMSYATKEPLPIPKKAVIDKRMEVACGRWPRYEGEILTILVLNGKSHCWEMGYDRKPGE
jgi:hypothetical protein